MDARSDFAAPWPACFGGKFLTYFRLLHLIMKPA